MQEQQLNRIIEQARTSPEAFGVLYDTFQPMMFSYVARRVSNTADAEDVCAQVFEKLLIGLGRFDPERASFKTWLYKVANNTVIDYYRERGKTRHLSLDEAMETYRYEGRVEVDYTRKYLQVMSLISELPSAHQEVLSLRFIEDMENDEIARVLGCSKRHAAVKLFRALKALRKLAADSGVLDEIEEGVSGGRG
ncbi:MAG: sigma-70 family RNA polymerase sigma factor [Actinobacteria bacterium]|nr:sigma-70 family RNA polymerase sigma factor [Actinomycetota bacterium]MBU1943457.1 sigma-70 family RNA polymerase sigma factor [Actinomycetota bacterium]MBU2686814.1 sigma-70 family RNA polymerase sigma factor [Actinomycetota bacterium]